MQQRVTIQSPGAPDVEREAAEKVVSCAQTWEDALGNEFRDRCMTFYRQYRGFRQFAEHWVAAPNDRDAVLYDAKKHWGSHLHIPLSFRTIETMVPRAIAQRPQMLVLPRAPQWAENARPVKLMLDAQQQRCDIDLPFQAVMRSGRIYGLGAGKAYWRKETSKYRPLRRAMFNRNKWVPKAKLEDRVIYDDPVFDDVDVFDLMWDIYASDVDTAEWMIHRQWFSTAQCLDRIEAGLWSTDSTAMLDRAKIESKADGGKYDEVWMERNAVSGFGSGSRTARGEQPHEVLEFHDGFRVLTVLDRTWLVQADENACCGLIPIAIYRPTPIQKQFVGIGDLEPLHHLQRELDTLRSQRRDAATLMLAGAFAYDEAAVERDNLVFGPGAAIPVTNANPRDAIQKLQFGDLPGSGYQEETVIRTDFDAVSGLQDGLDNTPGATVGTATEANLVQAAMGARIELGSRRFEIEVVRRATRCFLHLDQRMILEARNEMVPNNALLPDDQQEPGPEQPGQDEGSEGAYTWFTIDPEDLQGEFHVMPEGGSMAARNIPQDRQDGMQFIAMSQDPRLDGRRPLLKGLELMGVSDPETWLAQQAPSVPVNVIDSLRKVFGPTVDYVIAQEQQQNPQLPDPQQDPQQAGPTVPDVNAMMGVQS